jgi:hypothetical protein
MEMLVKISKKIVLIIISIIVISFVNHLIGSGVNKLDIDTSSLEFERILFVPGINTPNFYLNRWRADLKANFPDKEAVILSDNVYVYWQDDKTEAIVEKGVEILNDGRPTIVISHSYGGILAKTMIDRADNANVVKLVTMASPNQMNSFGIDNSKSFLGVPVEVDVPTFSFGGYVDPVVLFPFSDIKDDDPNHLDLWSGHGGFLFSKDIRREVLESIFRNDSITEEEN